MTAKMIGTSPSLNERHCDLRLIVLGNPENRRVHLFADATARQSRTRIEVVSWLEFLKDSSALTSRLAPGSILKIESPGENFEVERALLLRGCGDHLGDGYAWLSRDEVTQLEFQRGRILATRQWYCGWRRALESVEVCLTSVPQCRVINPPDDIAAMFDKARSHEILRECGVPVPPLLGIPKSFSELQAMMAEHKCNRIFLKPCHSSSASGVVALECSAASMQAFSSVHLVYEQQEMRLFNSLKIRRYSGVSEISVLVDAVCLQRSVAEVWLPKAGFEGRSLDLRVLVIAGSAAHVVVRQSCGPMTNLHLGNQRGDVPRLRERMGEANWQTALVACEKAAAAFPRSLYVAVDLLVAPSLRRFAVAEVNAFGDLLPNVLHEGLDTYSAELAALGDASARTSRYTHVSTIGL